ncbi:MAG: hypothetical protein WDW36_005866 [Sanguina aurantia]
MSHTSSEAHLCSSLKRVAHTPTECIPSSSTSSSSSTSTSLHTSSVSCLHTPTTPNFSARIGGAPPSFQAHSLTTHVLGCSSDGRSRRSHPTSGTTTFGPGGSSSGSSSSSSSSSARGISSSTSLWMGKGWKASREVSSEGTLRKEVHRCLSICELEQVVEAKARFMKPDMLLAALLQVSRCVHTPIPEEQQEPVARIMDQLLKRMTKTLDHYDLAQLVLVLEACTLVGHRPGQLLAELLPRLQREGRSGMSSGEPAHLASLASSLSGMGIVHAKLWQGLDDVILTCLTRMAPEDVTRVVVSHAQVGIQHGEILGLACSTLTSQLSRFTVQDVSQFVWGCGKLQLSSGTAHLLSKLPEWAAERMERFDHAQLAHFAWGVARMGLRHQSFARALATETARRYAEIQAEPEPDQLAYIIPEFIFAPQQPASHIPSQAVAVVLEAVVMMGARGGGPLYTEIPKNAAALAAFSSVQLLRMLEAAEHAGTTVPAAVALSQCLERLLQVGLGV